MRKICSFGSVCSVDTDAVYLVAFCTTLHLPKDFDATCH